ncbi:hypothetical protein CSIM01_08490 [Colletotrichum simmondsii]|uniref:Uncharacterized protein n=1 Tax=Colletotrichum simmondsii TaxID=703756 RepID=A0A135SXX6_9PEZI|nr:hypothetical protein CSIM01_08490 [Colletotrichum simmondsii]
MGFGAAGFLMAAVDAASTLVSVKLLVDASKPVANDPATLVTFTTGHHNDMTGAGGKIPHIALWDDFGKRIAQWHPGKNQKMASGADGDRHGQIVVKHNQNGGKGADPFYIMLSNHDDDAICISTITTCGQSWYYSDRTLGETRFTTPCVWLDGDHTDGLNAKAMSFHLNDFAPTQSKIDLYTMYPEKGYPYLCKSTPRFSFWGNLLPDGCIPFFDPPLKYTFDGADQGADEDPDIALDKQTYDKSVYLRQGERKISKRNNRSRTKKLSKRQGSNMDLERLIITKIEGQTAREICEDPNSVGYDILSYSDNMYCDISEKRLYPLCSGGTTSSCFNASSVQLIGEAGPLLARGEPAKLYKANFSSKHLVPYEHGNPRLQVSLGRSDRVDYFLQHFPGPAHICLEVSQEYTEKHLPYCIPRLDSRTPAPPPKPPKNPALNEKFPGSNTPSGAGRGPGGLPGSTPLKQAPPTAKTPEQILAPGNGWTITIFDGLANRGLKVDHNKYSNAVSGKVNTKEGSLVVSHAKMNDANRLVPLDQQVKLSNIQVEVLKKAGITPEKTKKLSHENVQESSTIPVLQAAMIGKGSAREVDSFTVSASATGADKKIFDDISKTMFGKNANWVNSDYVKKGVSGYRVYGGLKTPNLDALFP